VQGKSIADDKCRQVDPLSVSTPEFSGKYVPQEQYIAILNSLVTSQFLGKSNFPSILKLLKRLPQQKKSLATSSRHKGNLFSLAYYVAVMHCAMAERENQRTLREVIKSLALDPDYFFFLDDPNISPDTMKCTFVSMVCT
jgi:hypothetical protein